MKTKLLLVLVTLLSGARIYAQGSAFTYQGRLNDGTNLANGTYEIRFAVQGDATAQVPIGQPRTNSSVTVSNGLFTTVVDFGAIWDGSPMWLEIGVRPAGTTTFSNVLPRQLVTATPKAVYANRAGLYAGPIDVQQLPLGVVRGYADQTLTGAFTFAPLSGNPPFSVNSSVLVTNLNADKLDGLDSNDFWKIGGNANPVPPVLGTASTQPLQFIVGNRRALQLEFNTADIGRFTSLLSVNVIGGSSGNVVSNGVFGGTIGGGGNVTISSRFGNSTTMGLWVADLTTSPAT
jgi:hypothetical protein